jgi:predicted homoserine dehydrogenase-like protein
VICLGKGKNNPIDIHATPDSCAEEATSKNMNPQMLASFKDGTKTMVEMAAVSNATGLIPDVPGMHGLAVEYDDLLKVFIPKEDGGVLSQKGRVEFSTGRIAPGVFVIVRTDEPRIQTDMRFVSMGSGPYYLFVRPFHLCNIETPVSIAEAFFYREATVVAEHWASEVVSVAKRDIRIGDKIGGIGSPDIFHRIYTAQEAARLRAIPIGIAPGSIAKADIPCGQVLTTVNSTPDSNRFIYKLRRLQDEMLNPGSE